MKRARAVDERRRRAHHVVTPSCVTRCFSCCFLLWLVLIGQSFSFHQPPHSETVSCHKLEQSGSSLSSLLACSSSGRRRAIGYLLTAGGTTLTTPFSSIAEETSTIRPYAPLEALVPAARNRLLLSKCLELSDKLVVVPSKSKDYDSLVFKLKHIIPPLNSNSSIQNNNKILPTQLTGTSMRVAMNIYTANLRFADSYILTASKEDKKRLLRQYNQFPNVEQVVAADLDLRDLYRNSVKTKMDDVQAELYSNNMNVEELHSLLQQVDDTYRQWFALISEQDVQAAEKEARVDV